MNAPLDKLFGVEGATSEEDLELWRVQSALKEIRAKYYPSEPYYVPKPFEFAKLEQWKPSKHAKKR